MVKVAIAGGSGNVASEIIDGILAKSKHEVVVLTRQNTLKNTVAGIQYVIVDYFDKEHLVTTLRGIDVVLSFLVVHTDIGNVVQRNLIDACIEAGVKRFAPSEWAVKNNSGISSYENKDEVAKYLAEINKDKKVLEYCLFQPSFFLDYFAHPYSCAKTLITWPFFIDYENRRAMILEDGLQPIALTCIEDVAAVVAEALDYEGEWPAVGGMRGTSTTLRELITLGEELRGGPFEIERVSAADIEAGQLKTSWVPPMTHPVIPVEEREVFSKEFVIMLMLGILRGAWDVSDEWNKLLPQYEFTSAEEYLRKAWEGKP
ncbi:NmrA-like family protein-like protein [Glonium stellatum]|uniref:NmrA-like family protein-like protein n=1 Tax=Glonium stellatum TaxID=574774 RepID=A0A8E2F772_9PEZI|nr:NmrA-like family protein-like protein [Glonium stellatum]